MTNRSCGALWLACTYSPTGKCLPKAPSAVDYHSSSPPSAQFRAQVATDNRPNGGPQAFFTCVSRHRPSTHQLSFKIKSTSISSPPPAHPPVFPPTRFASHDCDGAKSLGLSGERKKPHSFGLVLLFPAAGRERASRRLHSTFDAVIGRTSLGID